jgi:hypothetical protein
MKTLFIVSEKMVDDHVGEEYDFILQVDDEPTTQNIQALADRVRTKIRGLWMEQMGEGDSDEVHAEPKVVCHLDAASPFNAMLIDLQLILNEEEGIVIELPYLPEGERMPQDPEAKELIEKIGSRV